MQDPKGSSKGSSFAFVVPFVAPEFQETKVKRATMQGFSLLYLAHLMRAKPGSFNP